MRIISLLSSATEILFGVGLGRQVLAVSHECDFPPEAIALPRATRSRIDSSRPSGEIDAEVRRLVEWGEALYDIDRDLIRQMKPELIVTQAQCDVCAVRYQDVIDFVAADPALAGTRVVSLQPATLSDVLADILRIGEAAGAASAAREYHDDLTARLDRVRSATSAIPPIERPRVVCLEWLDPLMAAGNWTPELIELAGGISGLAAAGQHSSYVDWQRVLAFDPQVVLLAPCGFDLARTLEEARHLSLPAEWNNNGSRPRIYALDGNAYLNRSGPRLIDTIEILAHLLHPSHIAPPGGLSCKMIPWRWLRYGSGNAPMA